MCVHVRVMHVFEFAYVLAHVHMLQHLWYSQKTDIGAGSLLLPCKILGNEPKLSSWQQAPLPQHILLAL